MQRNTKLDTPQSKVYGTKRIWTTTDSIERASTVAEADSKLEAAQQAATDAVARAVETAQDAKEIKAEQARLAAEETKKAADDVELGKKKVVAQEKAAKAVADAVNEVIGGDPVVDADTQLEATQGDDKDKPEKKKVAAKKE